MEGPRLPLDIPLEERTPLVNWLLTIIADQQRMIEQQQSTIQGLETKVEQLETKVGHLTEELKKAKKLKGRPKIKPSNLEQKSTDKKAQGNRPGSAKGSKKTSLEINEERIIEPKSLPVDAKFNGYREYDVQELLIKSHTIRFKLAEYVNSEGHTIVGKLPEEYQGHYGPTLKAFILYQHHQCRVPQNLIHEQLREFNIEISTGQVNRILMADKEDFHAEQDGVLRAGLETSTYIHTDDTSARHQGCNGYCTVLGNDLFAYFRSGESKSRQNFLGILRHPFDDYVTDYVS